MYEGFLFRNFWLWFNTLYITFLISLFLSEYEIFDYIWKSCITLFIALVSLMGAFDNINKNEINKRKRENYDAFYDLANTIVQRIEILSLYALHSREMMGMKDYYRGLYYPYIKINSDFKKIDYSKLGFIYKYKKEVGDKNRNYNLDTFNTSYLNRLDFEFRNILKNLDYRNEIREKHFSSIIENAPYLGNGKSFLHQDQFKGHVSYYMFTNYLNFTESIVESIFSLMDQYLSVAETLSDNSHLVYHGDASLEGREPVRLHLQGFDRTLKYIDLDSYAKQCLYDKQYPITYLNYRNL
ncbi:hypothetical protein [Vibrio diabolicus]|uniref:hypothetical protein n=1 Tax=Vibrio diabolicus TaxID=50719 RepID=UPI0022A84968|nr:hypothetical protein [Vibrio diabolicus]MCZ0922653.1 hypothetical protein [Vibrio diabolicus]